MKRNLVFQIIAAGLLFVAACGGGGGGGSASNSTGTINLSLSDASTSDYKAIYVTVLRVEVHRDGGGWDVISTPDQTLDLLRLVNGVREELALATLATGHYTQMRLILSDVPDDSLNALSVRHPYANYFIDNSNASIELKVPSGYQTGIKIIRGFDINANETTELVLDFDATRSIVRAGSSGQWLLKPTIKMMETKEYCIISGNTGQAGVLVSAQVYNSSAAYEERIQIGAATVSEDDGSYKLFVAPGSYTLVGYKDGYAPFFKSTKVVTVAGHTYTEDLALSTASMGTLIGGPISISGASAEQYSTVDIRKDATVGSSAEQIEVKSLNVANEGSFTTGLPAGSYDAVVSTAGKTAVHVGPFSVVAAGTADIGIIDF